MKLLISGRERLSSDLRNAFASSGLFRAAFFRNKCCNKDFTHIQWFNYAVAKRDVRQAFGTRPHMILQVFTYGREDQFSINVVCFQLLPSPMPDSIRICGDWIAPADKITSLLQKISSLLCWWFVFQCQRLYHAYNNIAYQNFRKPQVVALHCWFKNAVAVLCLQFFYSKLQHACAALFWTVVVFVDRYAILFAGINKYFAQGPGWCEKPTCSGPFSHERFIEIFIVLTHLKKWKHFVITQPLFPVFAHSS